MSSAQTPIKMRTLYSESFDQFHNCPKKASLYRLGPYQGTWAPIKRIMDSILLSPRIVDSSKWHRILDGFPIPFETIRNVLVWLVNRRLSIIAANARIMCGIGGEPVSVYVPYVLRTDGNITFVWPELGRTDWTPECTLRSPTICAMYLCAMAEQTLDPIAAYHSVVLAGTTVYEIRKQKKTLDTIRNMMTPLVRGFAHEKEAAIPGPSCTGCQAYPDCTAGQIGINRDTEGEVLLISRRETQEPIPGNQR